MHDLLVNIVAIIFYQQRSKSADPSKKRRERKSERRGGKRKRPDALQRESNTRPTFSVQCRSNKAYLTTLSQEAVHGVNRKQEENPNHWRRKE